MIEYHVNVAYTLQRLDANVAEKQSGKEKCMEMEGTDTCNQKRNTK